MQCHCIIRLGRYKLSNGLICLFVPHFVSINFLHFVQYTYVYLQKAIHMTFFWKALAGSAFQMKKAFLYAFLSFSLCLSFFLTQTATSVLNHQICSYRCWKYAQINRKNKRKEKRFFVIFSAVTKESFIPKDRACKKCKPNFWFHFFISIIA